MATIITRSGKGSALTHAEMDANLNNLNNDKLETGAVVSSGLEMSTDRLLGRTTASTGAVEEITVGSGLSLSSGTLTATGAGVSDGDYGDVTVSSSGTVWTVDNDAVTYAKIQNVSATDKLLGRSTAGAGDIEEISCTAAGRALLDDADAAAQRTTLGLGSIATLSAPTGTVVGTTDTQTLTNKTLGDLAETVFAITDGASVDLDPADGPIQTWTLGANRTPTATNFAAGESMMVMIADGTAYTVTWPTMTWVGGSAPTLATTGYTVVELWKVGSTLYGAHVGDVA